jgi:23S rRNA pseudouridine1911/1915/1917 synthase
MKSNLNVIYENEYLIIVEKPMGIPCQKDKTGDEDLLSIVCDYLGDKQEKTQLINRLDRPVGGLVILGKTKIDVSKLSMQMANREIIKEYLSVLCGKVDSFGEIENHLIKNQRLNKSKVVHKNTPNSKEAKLSYSKVQEIFTDEYGILSLVKVNLHTGRHHQIRVQFANMGTPIWGDTKYNDKFTRVREFTNIALWSHRLSIPNIGNPNILSFQLSQPEQYPFSLFSKLPYPGVRGKL